MEFPIVVNYCANLWAFKSVGVTHVLATTACGSLREEYAPGDLVCLSDFIDLTTQRLKTHVGTAVETGGPRLEKFLGQTVKWRTFLQVADH